MKYTAAAGFALVAAAAADGWESWDPASSSSSKAATTTTTSPTGWDAKPTGSSSKSASTTTTTTTSGWGVKPTGSSSASSSASKSCPATVTVVKTATETAYQATKEIYQTTVTVPIPEKPASVSVEPVWADWSKTSTASPVTTVPSGCTASATATSTTTSTTTLTGTTTVTKSTLYLGVGTGAAPAGPTGAWGGNGGDSSATGKAPGGNGLPGSIIGTASDVFKWTASAPSSLKTGTAPEYTQKPDGSYGGGAWGDWNGGSNSTTKNNTAPEPGSKASNVTKPYEPLKDAWCNDASNRGKWCDGKDKNTDYYQDYFSGKTCNFDLTLTRGTQNFDGSDFPAFLINGQTPGPAIECNWGDIITVNVHNKLDINGTTIHWHGIRQVGTNDQDGVPGITECAVAPGQSRTYTFHASSYGTSWYHSHWGVQYGEGIRGPIIIHGPATANYDVDAGPVMITDTFPNNFTANQQAWLVAHTGPQPTENYLLNGHNTKFDLSAGQHSLWNVQKGKKYLFRFINSAVQNHFSVSIDSHKLTVIAADFVPIVPYTTEWLNIGIGQRYDVIVEMDQKVDSYFLRAVTQNECPSACTNTGLGQANGIIAYQGVPTSPYQLPTSTVNDGKTISDFNICADEPLASLVPYLKKSAGTSSAFSASASTLPGGLVAQVSTNDDGNVFRWFLNNGALYVDYTDTTYDKLADDTFNDTKNNAIELHQKDKWVYFVIQNQFFAFHPMHLHGHDFSVLGSGDGVFTAGQVSTLNFDNPTRRDTTMLRGSPNPTVPGGYTVIGFETDNPGAWLMHCHIVWHVDGGLALQWIERPDDIDLDEYTGKASYKSECSTYKTYQASSPAARITSGQSGLKRDLYFDTEVARMNSNFNSIVRRENAAHHFMDSHLKRGLGDHHGRRQFGRR